VKLLVLTVWSVNAGLFMTIQSTVPGLMVGSPDLEQVAFDWAVPSLSFVIAGTLWRAFVLVGT